MDVITLNIFEITTHCLLQYEMLEKLVPYMSPNSHMKTASTSIIAFTIDVNPSGKTRVTAHWYNFTNILFFTNDDQFRCATGKDMFIELSFQA